MGVTTGELPEGISVKIIAGGRCRLPWGWFRRGAPGVDILRGWCDQVKRIRIRAVTGVLPEGIRLKIITGAAAGCPGDGAAGVPPVRIMDGVLRPG
jgi:hypothetical protein